MELAREGQTDDVLKTKHVADSSEKDARHIPAQGPHTPVQFAFGLTLHIPVEDLWLPLFGKPLDIKTSDTAYRVISYRLDCTRPIPAASVGHQAVGRCGRE